MSNSRASSEGKRALLLHAHGSALREVVSILEGCGIRVTTRCWDQSAARFAALIQPQLILMEHAEDCVQRWQDVAVHLRGSCPNAQLILLTACGSERVAVDALRSGVHDYLTLPVNASSVVDALTRCVAAASNSRSGTGNAQSQPETMVGDSELMMQIRSYMSRAAAADCTVLITGETGTGKELAAEYIHQHSPRREKPLVCINCAAIPELLLESELFGHARGAFTGAENQCDGLLASAKGGTVLLDEIGDMSLAAQAKILRVLEKKEVSQVGGTQRQKIDIRFLAATNQDLERMSIHGTFRRDLFYRLNVARVELPPLRERREDIPLLVNHYCSRLGGTGAVKFSEDCLRQLLRYDWPGNIRELKNVVESVLLAETRGYIDSEHLPQRLRANIVERCELPVDERERLVNALCSVQWNKSRAAEKLELSRMTLYRKMARYGIGPDGPRPLRQTSEV